MNKTSKGNPRHSKLSIQAMGRRVTRSTRLLTLGALISLGAFLQACASADLTEEDTASSAEAQVLVRKAPEAVAARRKEVEDWVLGGHARKGHRVVRTDTLADGTVIDWVERASVPGAEAPAPTIPLPSRPAGVQLAEATKVSGPEGAIPFARPAVPAYVAGDAVARDVQTYFASLPHGVPRTNRYAQFSKTATNYGASAAVNGNWTTADVPSGNNFMIEEVSSWCQKAGGSVGDMVGVVLGRDPAVYGAGYRLGAEYAINGTFNWIVGVDAFGETDGSFVQVSSAVFPGITIGNPSVPNGSQFESVIQVAFFDNNPNYPTAWWYFFNGTAFGYVPASAFTVGQLRTKGCIANQYSEGHDNAEPSGTPPVYPDWMAADMGSGLKPTGTTRSANFGTRANLRLPGYWASKNSGSWTLTSAAAFATNSACYGALRTTDGGADWNPSLFFGGPGGNGAGCD